MNETENGTPCADGCHCNCGDNCQCGGECFRVPQPWWETS